MLTEGSLVLYASLTKTALDKRTSTLDLTSNRVDYATTAGSASDISTSSAITDTNEGWAWYPDESTTAYDATKAITADNHPAKTLLLFGADIETTESNGVIVPDGTTIALSSGTTNTIKSGDGNYSML